MKPITLTAEMVRAVLAGEKTQTRRPVEPQPPEGVGKIIGPELYRPTRINRAGEQYPGAEVFGVYDEDGEWGAKCPWRVGGRVWARTPLRTVTRLTLEVVSVRIERLRVDDGETGPWLWVGELTRARA